jgi:hypothetical protein
VRLCEAKHKKQAKAGERELTIEELNRSLETTGVSSTCNGTVEEVMSADGTKVYGERCNRCGKSSVRCQVCGRMFANIARHLEDKKGNQLPCFAGNPEYRQARAVDAKLSKIGSLR